MNIEEIKKSIDTDLEHITKQNELNDIKSKYLGKEGVITLLQSKIREIPNEEKKEYGIKDNEVRTYFNIVDRIDTSKFDKYIPNKRDYINGKYLTNYGAIIFGKLLIDFGEITEEKIIKTTRDINIQKLIQIKTNYQKKNYHKVSRIKK